MGKIIYNIEIWNCNENMELIKRWDLKSRK